MLLRARLTGLASFPRFTRFTRLTRLTRFADFVLTRLERGALGLERSVLYFGVWALLLLPMRLVALVRMMLMPTFAVLMVMIVTVGHLLAATLTFSLAAER